MQKNFFDEDDDQTYELIRESVAALGVVFTLGILAICFYPFF